METIEKLGRNHAFIAGMFRLENSTDYEPRVFYSMLECTKIPNDVGDLFLSMLVQLRREWDEFMEAFTEIISDNVSKALSIAFWLSKMKIWLADI